MSGQNSGLQTRSGIAVEREGWGVLRRRMPNLDRQPAKTLLALAVGLAGSLRYVRTNQATGRGVLLLGEIPCGEDSACRSMSRPSIAGWAGMPVRISSA